MYTVQWREGGWVQCVCENVSERAMTWMNQPVPADVCVCVHGQTVPRVLHGHNGRDKERLVAQLRDNDDGERREEAMEEAGVRLLDAAAVRRCMVLLACSRDRGDRILRGHNVGVGAD